MHIRGLLIDTTENYDMIEMCSSTVCTYIANYASESKIFLPTSIVLFEYAVAIQSWTNGSRQFHTTLECDGKPICEAPDCTICWEHLYNPKCWTIEEIVTVVTLVFCRLMSPPHIFLWWLVKSFCRLLKSIVCLLRRSVRCRRRQSYTLPKFPTYNKRLRQKILRNALLVTALAAILQHTSSRSDIVMPQIHHTIANTTAPSRHVQWITQQHFIFNPLDKKHAW